jgi:ABC-type transporter Mla maintaining outer membrane lipid asymmetry ATPase subunit MlaF
MSADSKPVLKLQGIAIGSLLEPDRVILYCDEWLVYKGEFWVVGGLSGSGKSDFLRFLGGLFPPVAGKYEFLGELMPIIDDRRLPIRLKLAFIPEDGGLLAKFTVLENVMLPCTYHLGMPEIQAKNRAMELLDLVGCAGLGPAFPRHLRFEQCRRVAIARALTLDPEVLLIDCPLRGLDPVQTQWWLHLLWGLNQGQSKVSTSPITLIVSTTSLSPWGKKGYKFAMLEEGKFKLIGDWDSIAVTNDTGVQVLL